MDIAMSNIIEEITIIKKELIINSRRKIQKK